MLTHGGVETLVLTQDEGTWGSGRLTAPEPPLTRVPPKLQPHHDARRRLLDPPARERSPTGHQCGARDCGEDGQDALIQNVSKRRTQRAQEPGVTW